MNKNNGSRGFYRLPFLLLAAGFFGCSLLIYTPSFDSLGYPVIGNACDSPFFIKARYSEGVDLEDTIPAKTDISSMGKRGKLISIRVFDLKESLIADFPEAYFNEKRLKNSTKEEFWALTSVGWDLIPKQYHSKKGWTEFKQNISCIDGIKPSL